MMYRFMLHHPAVFIAVMVAWYVVAIVLLIAGLDDEDLY